MTGLLAYMDPGTGSLFLQVLLGGIAGLLVFVKLFWHRFLSFFGMRRETPTTTSQPLVETDRPDQQT